VPSYLKRPSKLKFRYHEINHFHRTGETAFDFAERRKDEKLLNVLLGFSNLIAAWIPGKWKPNYSDELICYLSCR
jgi:hypothetical protein